MALEAETCSCCINIITFVARLSWLFNTFVISYHILLCLLTVRITTLCSFWMFVTEQFSAQNVEFMHHKIEVFWVVTSCLLVGMFLSFPWNVISAVFVSYLDRGWRQYLSWLTFSTIFHFTGRSQKKNTAGIIYYYYILYNINILFFSVPYWRVPQILISALVLKFYWPSITLCRNLFWKTDKIRQKNKPLPDQFVRT
jgi:hypothetical protein